MCVWGWWVYAKRKAFRDPKDPAFIVQHFTPKEIRRVKWFAISCLIVALHGIGNLIFRSIWPQVFS